MTRSRRKKILTWTLLVILLLVAVGYAFRYSLIREYQYSRLKALRCSAGGEIKIDCKDRIWVHRVNSVERYEILEDDFEGFEMDVAYDDSLHTYFVYHPPKPENEDVPQLREFLSHVDTVHKRFWLDIRGVDSSNMHEALDVLKQVVGPVNSNHLTFFIELYDMKAAKLFAGEGIRVMFNVSELLLQRMITDKSLQDSVNNELQGVPLVSQDFRYIDFLKRFFPSKQIMTWHPEFKVFIDTKELQKILDDKQVRVVLVGIKSRYYR